MQCGIMACIHADPCHSEQACTAMHILIDPPCTHCSTVSAAIISLLYEHVIVLYKSGLSDEGQTLAWVCNTLGHFLLWHRHYCDVFNLSAEND